MKLIDLSSWSNHHEIKGAYSLVIIKAFGRSETSGMMIPEEPRSAETRISLECASIIPRIEQDTHLHIKKWKEYSI